AKLRELGREQHTGAALDPDGDALVRVGAWADKEVHRGGECLVGHPLPVQGHRQLEEVHAANRSLRNPAHLLRSGIARYSNAHRRRRSSPGSASRARPDPGSGWRTSAALPPRWNTAAPTADSPPA